MKATLVIRRDNAKLHELLETFHKRSRSGQNGKRAVFNEIRHELTLHSTIKKEVFYAELKTASTAGNAGALIDALMEDYSRIDKILSEIENSNADDKVLESKMSRLTEIVEAHIAKEEDELFAEARGALSEQKLEELGLEMDHRRRLFTQPAA